MITNPMGSTMSDKEAAMFAVLDKRDMWVIINALSHVTTGHTIALHRRMVDAAYPPANVPQMAPDLD